MATLHAHGEKTSMSQPVGNYRINFQADQITETQLKAIMDTIVNNNWTILIIQKVG